MRVYVLFTDEPVFHPRILSELIAGRGHDIVGVGGVAHRRGRKGQVDYLRDQLRFWGAKGFALNTLAVVRSRLLDRAARRGLGRPVHSLASVCAAAGVPYREVQNVNAPDYLAWLRTLHLDVIVSSQGQIFGAELLALPRLGAINRHSALLPAYGGLKPIFWAVLNGEREVGVSVHVMEAAIDRGAVLTRRRVAIGSGSTVYELYAKVFEASGPAILEALDLLEHGRPPAVEPADGASYFRDPTPADLRAFRERGYRMA